MLQSKSNVNIIFMSSFWYRAKRKTPNLFSTDIKPNYRTSIWADVFASATDDPYTVNDLQLKRDRKKGIAG